MRQANGFLFDVLRSYWFLVHFFDEEKAAY
jgi:hypothetical protein